MERVRELIIVLVLSVHAACAWPLRAPPIRNFTVSVTDFGAKGDGVTVNTKAFERAVAAVAGHGSGQIIVPAPGTFVTAPFNLTSHCTLYLEAGATLLGAPDMALHPVVAPLPSYGSGRDHGPRGRGRRQALIGGAHLVDVAVTGANGTVDGNGAIWWHHHKSGHELYTRGHLLEFMYSEDVHISNVFFTNSPFWTLHPFACKNVYAGGITIKNPLDARVAPNTDGFDPDSCDGVVLEDSYIEAGDDIVAIKSGWDCFGIEFGTPSANIYIRNLTGTSPCCAGICIGSEMSGGVANVTVEDSHLYAGQGLRVKAGLGRGGFVTNITYRNTWVGGRLVGIEANDYYGSPNGACPPIPVAKKPVPKVAGLRYENLQIVLDPGAAAVDFRGLPNAGHGPITGVAMDQVAFSGNEGGWTCSNVSGTVHDVSGTTPCAALTPPQ